MLTASKLTPEGKESFINFNSLGVVKINLNPNDTLIKLDAIKTSLQRGQIPIGEIRFGIYGNEDPMYILAGLPFIAPDYASAWLLKEVKHAYLQEKFNKKGLRILYTSPWPGQGFYTKFPVNKVSDFNGKNFAFIIKLIKKKLEV